MKNEKLIVMIVAGIFACGCQGGSSSGSYAAASLISGANVVPLTVTCDYIDEPCVEVTVCNPSTGQCQVVPNVLLDTGSYGLRVFSSSISNLGLTPVTSGGESIAECQNYLDNSADWGPIAMANVQLGNETTSQSIPIQLIDASLPGAQSAGCQNPAASPTSTGYNGILGIGPHIADCGPACANYPGSNGGGYFACDSNGSCTGTTVAEGGVGSTLSFFQVSNPVAFLPIDNNGVTIVLPDIADQGVTGASGYLVLGIGTNANNTVAPSSVTVIPTNEDGDFQTTFEGRSYNSSFLDTGSNALFFPQSNTGLGTDSGGFYTTPNGLQTFSAQLSDGVQNHTVNFEILSADLAFSNFSTNNVFKNIGAAFPGNFDWGLPFFFGRTVYVSLENTQTNLGQGPYVAF